MIKRFKTSWIEFLDEQLMSLNRVKSSLYEFGSCNNRVKIIVQTQFI